MLFRSADPVSPYQGGKRLRQGRFAGETLSTDETLRYWVAMNGLDDTPEKQRLPHITSSDRTSVDRVTWRAPGKAAAVLYTINNGGHLVPQPYWRFPSQVGLQTGDIDATQIIWDFFKDAASRK